MRKIFTSVIVLATFALYAQTEVVSLFNARLDNIPSIMLQNVRKDDLSLYSLILRGQKAKNDFYQSLLSSGRRLAQMPIIIPKEIGDRKMIILPKEGIDYKMIILGQNTK